MNIPQLERGENGEMPEVVNQWFLFPLAALQESRNAGRLDPGGFTGTDPAR